MDKWIRESLEKGNFKFVIFIVLERKNFKKFHKNHYFEKLKHFFLFAGLSLWIVFIGHVTFLFVTRPSSANSNFPFHIRTTQVVPIDSGQGHSYEPRGRTTTTLFTLSHSPPPQYNTNITE